MLTRFQVWMGETHGSGFELTRHFLTRFFDSEMAPAAGEWQKVAIGCVATLLSASMLGLRIFFRRYNNPESPAFLDAQIYREWVRDDMLWFIGIAMAITALLTILQWQSLFPSARDCLALAGLPVTAGQIFRAKFTALLLLFGTYVIALTLVPAAAFAMVIGNRWQENLSALANFTANFAALAGACIFVFFGLLAIQGLLLNFLPGWAFARVSVIVQGTLFIGTLGSLPLIGRQPANAVWWPPVWFLRLWEAIITGPPALARYATAAVVLPPIICAAAYVVSYRRYQRLLLETPQHHSTHWRGAGPWLLERWIGDPREQAVFVFIAKMLARSRIHRLILLAYGGVALGWIVKGALDTPRPSLRDEGMYGLLLVMVPLALAMLVTIGLRYAFSLPVSLNANWVFPTANKLGAAAWLAAADRFVIWCGLAPLFVASLPAAVAILGWWRAPAAVILTFLAAVLWFEALFRQWRKIPFTCTYLAGKQPVWLVAVRYGLALPLLAPAGKLILVCSASVMPFVALFTFEVVLWWRLRTRRRLLWETCRIRYEEVPDPAVFGLDISPDGGRAEGVLKTSEMRMADEERAPLFSASLVESRGLLPETWTEEIKEERRSLSLLFATFLEDARYGLRLIRRSPLFSAAVVLTLTIGIGINASVFTLVNGLAFRPHVYRDPASFVRVILQARMQGTIRRASYPEYITYRDNSRCLRQLAAWAHFPAFIGEDQSAGSVGMAVSCNFFQVDGREKAIAGRLFIEEDCDSPGRMPAAVISEVLWRVRFASDPAIVGRVIELNNLPIRVVGVGANRTGAWASSEGWTRSASMWVPYTAHANFEMGNAFAPEHLWLSLAGRLAPGVTRTAAAAELSMLAAEHDRRHFGRQTAVETTDGSWLKELELTMTGQQLMLAALFGGAFNLVLFISCANVATLLLARGTVRCREIAVRLSLGAGRVRVVRMLVTESLVLAGIAGMASFYLAWRLPEPLFRVIAGRMPDFPMPADWRTFAYVAMVVLLVGILAGLAPALESIKVSLSGSLKGGQATSGSGNVRRLEALLVSAQVAMSMVLLVGAALFARAEGRTLRADPGYLPKQVVVAPLFFTDDSTRQAAAVRLLSIAERVRALPGVHSVAFSEGIPLFSHDTVEMRPPSRPDANQPVDVYTASPAFFETLGIAMVKGREFDLLEISSIVVSQSLARAFWPRQEPLGKELMLPGGRVRVVGVVKDIDALRFGGSDNPALYRPWILHPQRNFLSVRFESGASAGAAAVRAAIREMDPKLLVMARLVQEWMEQVTEDLWNVVALIGMLGLVAAVLATTGIYGAVSFAVSQRTKELGIRVALGAQRRDIVREVLVSGGVPVLKGMLVGLWLSAAVSVGLQQSVKGSPLRLETGNPLVYAGAVLVLWMAAVIAMVEPARRGASSDPLDALRCE